MGALGHVGATALKRRVMGGLMFVQVSDGLSSGSLRFGDSRVQVSPRLRLAIATHPALMIDEAGVFHGLAQNPQFKLIAARALHWADSPMKCITGAPALLGRSRQRIGDRSGCLQRP